ncbi:MAG: cytochrome c biogenesis protein [Bacteroidota bacterium]|nr:cytochrome c biogenesis protein [Bacteroidota bacterium]
MAQPAKNNFGHWWWKILGAILLLGASITALRTPLEPALVHVSPDRVGAGPVDLTITGYNTSFSDQYQVYFINGDQRICASSISSGAANKLSAHFDIPGGVKANLSSIVVHHPDEGRLGMPNAIFHTSTGEGTITLSCAEAPANAIGSGEFSFPDRNILYETIRNLNFHVPMWFTMMTLMAISLGYSIKNLGSKDLAHDRSAAVAVHIGLLFCGLGLATGAVWARSTWGAWWTNDVKLNGAAVTALIYLAYLVLRGSITEPFRRARLASVYNIFAFMLLVLFLLVLPRMNTVDSLHPGSGGNPAFNQYDLDDDLRLVFYPAVAGWILLGIWMFQLRDRAKRLQNRLADRDQPLLRSAGRPIVFKKIQGI